MDSLTIWDPQSYVSAPDWALYLRYTGRILLVRAITGPNMGLWYPLTGPPGSALVCIVAKSGITMAGNLYRKLESLGCDPNKYGSMFGTLGDMLVVRDITKSYQLPKDHSEEDPLYQDNLTNIGVNSIRPNGWYFTLTPGEIFPWTWLCLVKGRGEESKIEQPRRFVVGSFTCNGFCPTPFFKRRNVAGTGILETYPHMFDENGMIRINSPTEKQMENNN